MQVIILEFPLVTFCFIQWFICSVTVISTCSLDGCVLVANHVASRAYIWLLKDILKVINHVTGNKMARHVAVA